LKEVGPPLVFSTNLIPAGAHPMGVVAI
jgi:hypothetical protein